MGEPSDGIRSKLRPRGAMPFFWPSSSPEHTHTNPMFCCVQEKLEHGKVHCLIASSNGRYTIGFTGGIRLNPMALLNKNQIDSSKAITKFEILKTKRD